jgi:hypothetical protein
MNPPPLLAIAVVVSLSTFYLVLLWIGIGHAQKNGPVDAVVRRPLPSRPLPSGSLEVIDRHDKVAVTVALDGALRSALSNLGPLKFRLLAMRFGLTDGHSLSRADAAWVLHRSEEEVKSIEADALHELGPEGRAMLENLNLRPRPRHRPDSGGYQTSGRPLPLKPTPPSLSAAAEVELPEPND